MKTLRENVKVVGQLQQMGNQQEGTMTFAIVGVRDMGVPLILDNNAVAKIATKNIGDSIGVLGNLGSDDNNYPMLEVIKIY